MKKKILIGLGILLLALQFLKIDKTNPVASPESDFFVVTEAPDYVKNYFKNACYDCHSNQTSYPWYTNISPVSYWIKGHITNARENLNFSEWASQYDASGKSHKIRETIEEIESGHMPPKSYKWMHPEARFSDDEKLEVLTWLKANASQ